MRCIIHTHNEYYSATIKKEILTFVTTWTGLQVKYTQADKKKTNTV